MLAIIGICFAALLASFSRSAMIGLALGMVALFAMNRAGKRHAKCKEGVGSSLGAAMLLIILIGLIFSVSYGNLWSTRIQAEARLEKLSVQERTSQVGQAIGVIRQSQPLGVGAGTYTKFIAVTDEYKKPIWKYQPVHNTPLLVFAEIGVIGVLLLTILMVIAAIRLNRSCDWGYNEGVGVRSAIVAPLVVFATTAMFDHWHWDNHMGITILALFVGLLRKRKGK